MSDYMGRRPSRPPDEPGERAMPRLLPLADLTDEFLAEAEATHSAREEGKLRGPATRLLTLDREIGGALPNGLNVAHGGPGVGKTAFACQVAASCGFPALIVSAEMSPLEL